MRQRIGVLGGAFNPPHFAHLRGALEAKEALHLDRLLLLPSGEHPFKGSDILAPVAHRLAMVRLAVADEPAFRVCELETSHSGVSYTVETLARLKERFPGDELHFLVGADNLAELHLWRQWERLPELARLAVLARPGYESHLRQAEAVRRFGDLLPHDHPQADQAAWRHVPITILGISSSDIRARLKRRESIRYLLPDAVIAYIREHGLYGVGEERT